MVAHRRTEEPGFRQVHLCKQTQCRMGQCAMFEHRLVADRLIHGPAKGMVASTQPFANEAGLEVRF